MSKIKVLFICHGLQFYDNAYLRRLGQHRAESLGITTVSTTNAHRGFARIVKEIGRNP